MERHVYFRGLLCQWASTIKIQLCVLVQYKADLSIISLKINLFSPWYTCSWKIAELELNYIFQYCIETIIIYFPDNSAYKGHNIKIYKTCQWQSCWMSTGTPQSMITFHIFDFILKYIDMFLSNYPFRVMVFNATFNNISAISWRSVLLVEETRVPEENHWPAASHWQTLSHNVVSSTPHLLML